jgi:DNA-binding protein H-NS
MISKIYNKIVSLFKKEELVVQKLVVQVEPPKALKAKKAAPRKKVASKKEK